MIEFISDPRNAMMLYLLSGAMFIIGIVLLLILRRGNSGDVQVGGDNPGIINTGQVKGKLQVGNSTTDKKERSRSATALDIGAKLATIGGFFLALWVFIASTNFA